MPPINKTEYFDSLDKPQIISSVLMYIEDKMRVKGVYNIDAHPYLLVAVSKLLDGTHAWDIEKTPDPTYILGRSVWREISHELGRRRTNPEYKNFHHPLPLDDVLNTVDGSISQDSEAGHTYEADELFIKIKEIAEEKNEDAWYYLEAFMELILKTGREPKRAEIANHLGWEPIQVTNAMRWVQRNTGHLLVKQNTEVIE